MAFLLFNVNGQSSVITKDNYILVGKNKARYEAIGDTLYEISSGNVEWEFHTAYGLRISHTVNLIDTNVLILTLTTDGRGNVIDINGGVIQISKQEADSYSARIRAAIG